MENISIVRVSSISVGSHLSIFHNTILKGLAHQSSIIANYIFIFLLFFKTKIPDTRQDAGTDTGRTLNKFSFNSEMLMK